MSKVPLFFSFLLSSAFGVHKLQSIKATPECLLGSLHSSRAAPFTPLVEVTVLKAEDY